jgi:hypothetical protein
MMCCTARPRPKQNKFILENGTTIYADTIQAAIDKLYPSPRVKTCTLLNNDEWHVAFEKGVTMIVTECETQAHARDKAYWYLYLDKRDPKMARTQSSM